MPLIFSLSLRLRILGSAGLLWCAMYAWGGPADFFMIQVVDAATGRGVPLVSLRTTHDTVWWTDSNGIIAFSEPGLMDLEVFFHVQSPGYDYPKDGFGNRGVKLQTHPGGNATIKLQRSNIAERLYRITGAGIYRDSVLLGRSVPLKHPVINGQVMGQDTVIATPYRGKIYWFWGDTDRPSYALGNFGASGATSDLPGVGGLDPGVGVDLNYFVDEHGFSKAMCHLPGPGAHWIEGLFTIPDGHGGERLAATVANHKDLAEAQSWDLMLYDDAKNVFEPLEHWNIHAGHDSAHPFKARSDGVDYFYLFPNFRVKADLDSLRRRENYEAFTCVAGDGRWRAGDTTLDRDAAGLLQYRWKAGADRLTPGWERKFVSDGKLQPEENWLDLHDFEDGTRVPASRGSVYWNSFRQRWIMLIAPRSKAGEVWFAEGDTPTGPWVYARRVATHGDYNFYNPTQHPFFDQDGGRLVYFEGTYTDTFSGARSRTPRYNYNQLMYRLALDDPRLNLPVPVYRLHDTDGKIRFGLRDQVTASEAWKQIEEIAWFAWPAQKDNRSGVPIYANSKDSAGLSLTPPQPNARPLFFGLPLADSGSTNAAEFRSPALATLMEYRRASDNRCEYSTQTKPPKGCLPEGRPICRVWQAPNRKPSLDWKAQVIPPQGR